ncbi:hypothetical protein THAOC_35455 [Thalassiosira oceanica]|uniref:MYND-type domain-containing protein n=1 Tax=Thalassiosira oceanica TaxID=159749 RepID=K0R0W1_THAOC|nr:hypothetical protein THAOC_35455 [Thalassiosira oceanica]|eukprot:EJK45908.1 hypothetical protein THAOC_35455 [Thalassiosira oceanica]
MTLAKRGVSWAQTSVGRSMIYGQGGFKKQEKAGLEWLNKAVAQDFPPALSELSDLHRVGFKSVVRKSQEKANKLLLKSANLDYAFANSELASYYIRGANGFEMNPDESYFRASVAFALDGADGQAAFILGGFHYDKDVPRPSPYLACYYTNIATSEDDNGYSCHMYSKSLLRLTSHLHGGYAINGSNDKAAIFFWSRKSRDLGCDDAIRLLKKWESNEQSSCANCAKKAEAGAKFKQCSKCTAQWYCSKECQVKAWRAGHKKDCKRARILKFEDFLYSE